MSSTVLKNSGVISGRLTKLLLNSDGSYAVTIEYYSGLAYSHGYVYKGADIEEANFTYEYYKG